MLLFGLLIKPEDIIYMKVITRFAPSPTGYLHIGNARTALINWLFARKNKGRFILRIDDTDTIRSKEEYKKAIENDLLWLGLEWDESFNQLSRLHRYNQIREMLIASERLYPCFESSEELEIKRKLQLANGKPPIYDRASLNLTSKQKQDLLSQGKSPHYRFRLENKEIKWSDLIRGEVSYKAEHLSDPIVVREDGNMTYMLCSVIDDIDYNITHIFRGEDHVTNTALQMQMFESIGASTPNFGHLSLVRASEEKISKRIGGFEIANLKDEIFLEPMTINSFFALIGSSKELVPYKNLAELTNSFEINSFSKSPTTYYAQELEKLNHKLLLNLSYNQVKDQVEAIVGEPIEEKFWLAIRANLNKLNDIKLWWQICYQPNKIKVSDDDKNFLSIATKLLPNEEISLETWSKWTKLIGEQTGKKGKELFLPLRLALTGHEHGPDMKTIVSLLTREEILTRLKS